MRGAIEEVDARHAALTHRVDQVLHARQRKTTIARLVEDAGPRIEDLDRLHAGIDLQPQVVRHRDVELFEERFERRGLAIHQPLDRAEAFLALALHQVGGNGERRAAEANQRRAAVELAAQQADRIGHERHRLRGRTGLEAIDLRARADRIGNLRPRLERHRDAECIERHHDVGEQDRRIHLEAAQRLQRHLGGQFRRAAHGQEIVAAADLAVFGQVAAGLPHDPQRRAIDRLAPAGAQKTIVHATASRRAPLHGVNGLVDHRGIVRERHERGFKRRRRQQDVAREHGAEEPRVALAIDRSRVVPRTNRPLREEQRPHRRDALHRYRDAGVAGGRGERAFERGAARFEDVVELDIRIDGIEHREAGGDRQRMRRKGAGLVDRARRARPAPSASGCRRTRRAASRRR